MELEALKYTRIALVFVYILVKVMDILLLLPYLIYFFYQLIYN